MSGEAFVSFNKFEINLGLFCYFKVSSVFAGCLGDSSVVFGRFCIFRVLGCGFVYVKDRLVYIFREYGIFIAFGF